MKTIWEVFDTVKAHLLAQGCKAKSDGDACAYRAPSGLRCAVGFLIPDEYYKPAMEGYGLPERITGYSVCDAQQLLIGALLLAGVPVLDEGVLAMLKKCQQIHDNTDPDTWRSKLNAIERDLLDQGIE